MLLEWLLGGLVLFAIGWVAGAIGKLLGYGHHTGELGLANFWETLMFGLLVLLFSGPFIGLLTVWVVWATSPRFPTVSGVVGTLFFGFSCWFVIRLLPERRR